MKDGEDKDLYRRVLLVVDADIRGPGAESGNRRPTFEELDLDLPGTTVCLEDGPYERQIVGNVVLVLPYVRPKSRPIATRKTKAHK